LDVPEYDCGHIVEGSIMNCQDMNQRDWFIKVEIGKYVREMER
jgi:hypothetical protein